tara:strand:- start:377 stop:598 length:222 start_codon:yes stop_codon:yes gene_type:complete
LELVERQLQLVDQIHALRLVMDQIQFLHVLHLQVVVEVHQQIQLVDQYQEVVMVDQVVEVNKVNLVDQEILHQ